MTQSVLLVIITALATWLLLRWTKTKPRLARLLSLEEEEAGRAKEIGVQLDGARERASEVEEERNKLALAKALKAALWVTESRLNIAVPDLLKLAQRWVGQAERRGEAWHAPEGVTLIEGHDDPNSPWAAWVFDDHHWRVEAQWRPSMIPEEIEDDLGTCKVFVDEKVMLDMTISSKDRQVMWIDALTVGPWVSDLLAFAGVQSSDAKARSSDRSARKNQDRADKIHWL